MSSAGTGSPDRSGARGADADISAGDTSNGQGSGADPSADPASVGVLDALLAGFGITGPQRRGDVLETVNELLRGTEATATGLRWGTLTITAPSAQARLLRFEHDLILGALADRFGDEVTSLRITVARPSARPRRR